MDDLKEVIAKLEALTRERGFIYNLAFILMRDMFFDPSKAADIDWHDHLSFQELTFLVGLLVKHEINFEIPTQEESSKQFEQTYSLFKELHQKHTNRIAKKVTDDIANKEANETAPDNHREIFGSADSITEAIFYSGSGAYDFQYLDFAIKKYQKDSDWLMKNKGLEIPSATEIAGFLKKFNEQKYMARPHMDSEDFSGLCQAALSVSCFTLEDIKGYGKNVEPFLGAFSLVPGTVNRNLEMPGQYNELQSRPIVKFQDGRFFLPVGFNLTESIYESPFYWMNSDPTYRSEALRHRGEFAEEFAAELLRSVFGKNNVYTRVEVKKDKGTTVTDIDVLVIVGNKAIIAQVKSKRLTELSRIGNEEKLKKDFESAVQEAYDQGHLSRSAIVDKSNKLFVDGKELILSEQIDDAYILCLTLDHYPAVTQQVDVYLKKEPIDPFPIAISMFDLDILTFYLSDPFEFLYYIHQRIKYYERFNADSEITLLAVHLKHKLQPHNEYDMESYDNSFTQLIDANFPALRGSFSKTEVTQKLHSEWKNAEFKKLIDEVKSTGEPGFTDAIFFLYDIAGKRADKLVEIINQLKEKTAKDHQTHDARLVYNEFKAGITVMTGSGSLNELRKKLVPHSITSKYKSRADIWLSLGIIVKSKNFVDVLGFDKERWKLDSEFEEVMKDHLEPNRPTGNKIGRNEKCTCGSGKKYKRCHGR